LEILKKVEQGFAVWVGLAGVIGYLEPAAFRWFAPYIVPGLGVIMLGMGVTLVPADFARVARRWPAVAVGVIAQYGVMPLAGLSVATALLLPPELAVGVLLVCCCPGGTASNVIAYLAGADVALSISLTAVSTILSPLLTPALLLLYAGESIDVSATAQAITIAKIVLLPVLAGLAVRTLLDRRAAPERTARVLLFLPLVSIAFIVLIVGCIVALNAERLATIGAAVGAAVLLTNAIGLLGGYGIARALRFDRATARTLAIEVGMQNSGLGVALASTYFTPATALPSAFYSLWHNLSGPALAAWWRRAASAERESSPSA
jgi:BASS family bile acid:Na+ symporter